MHAIDSQRNINIYKMLVGIVLQHLEILVKMENSPAEVRIYLAKNTNIDCSFQMTMTVVPELCKWS